MLGTNTLVLGAVFLLKDRLASCHFKEQRVLSCKPFTILLKRFPFVGRKKIPVWGSLLFLFNVRHLADPIGDGHLELSVCWMAWKERGPVREGLTGDCHWKSVLPEAAVGGGGGGRRWAVLGDPACEISLSLTDGTLLADTAVETSV